MTIQTEDPPLRAAVPRLLPSTITSDASESAYDRVFWLTYLANGLTTLANAMLVRYADFVELLGGGERQLGLIVGVAMVGSITMRLFQGVGIDRYGAGRIWQCSSILFTLSLLVHMQISTAYGPGVFLARAMLQASLAGIFGSSITFVSLRVSPPRMAEVIGTLGTSGFLGILVGPLLSDWICGGSSITHREVDRLFLTAGVMATLATFACWYATAGDPRPAARRRPGVTKLVRRYTSVAVAIVAVAMGAGFSIPFTFLRPFAADLHIGRVGFYFAIYASMAFATRLATRQLFERHGNRPWIIVGMTLLTVSFLLYLPVRATWHLAIPATIAGAAHALLFPSVMSAGTTVFPRRYRGVATSVMLAMFDLGTFLGAPVAGTAVEFFKRTTDDAYPTMFAGGAVLFAFVTVAYGQWFSITKGNGFASIDRNR